jgi:hypothetical protein
MIRAVRRVNLRGAGFEDLFRDAPAPSAMCAALTGVSALRFHRKSTSAGGRIDPRPRPFSRRTIQKKNS